jgi:hypothetical protein
MSLLQRWRSTSSMVLPSGSRTAASRRPVVDDDAEHVAVECGVYLRHVIRAQQQLEPCQRSELHRHAANGRGPQAGCEHVVVEARHGLDVGRRQRDTRDGHPRLRQHGGTTDD